MHTRPQWSLWGNKTDLSLLVDASAINPVAASSASSAGGPLLRRGEGAGGSVRSANPHVIVDEYDAVWEVLAGADNQHGATSAAGRVDIVLDNAGEMLPTAHACDEGHQH
jgi:hypothetical protein